MVEYTGQAGVDEQLTVTREMRAAGAAILLDPDLAFSAEEKAEAVYIAMVSLLEHHTVDGRSQMGALPSSKDE